MTFEAVLREVERSFVWHAVGDLVRHLDWGLLLFGLLAIAAIALLSSYGRRASAARASSPAPSVAPQSFTSSVHCACGRRWSVRT